MALCVWRVCEVRTSSHTETQLRDDFANLFKTLALCLLPTDYAGPFLSLQTPSFKSARLSKVLQKLAQRALQGWEAQICERSEAALGQEVRVSTFWAEVGFPSRPASPLLAVADT